MDTQKERLGYRILDGTMLKWIALITMLIDHIGAAVIEMGVTEAYSGGAGRLSYEAAMRWLRLDVPLRMIGRISFPIYCFLLVEGFLHTGNVKKYGIRLLIFGLISEIPFDLAFNPSAFFPESQNVYFTLLLGLIALYFLRRYEGCAWKQAAVFLACGGASWICRTDYSAYGVFLIVFLYEIRDLPQMFRMSAGALAMAYEGIPDPKYLTAALAAVPIGLYNGKKGKARSRFLFYWFYPAHLILLYLIRRILFG